MIKHVPFGVIISDEYRFLDKAIGINYNLLKIKQGGCMRKIWLLVILVGIMFVWGCTQEVEEPTTIEPVNEIYEFVAPVSYTDADGNIMLNTEEHAKMVIAWNDTLKAVMATSVNLATVCTNIDEGGFEVVVSENAPENFNDTTWIWHNYGDNAQLEMTIENGNNYIFNGFYNNLRVIGRTITGDLPATIDREWDCYPAGIYRYHLSQTDERTLITGNIESADLGVDTTYIALDYNISGDASNRTVEAYIMYPEIILNTNGVDSALVYHMAYISQTQEVDEDGNITQTGTSKIWIYDSNAPEFPADSTGYNIWIQWNADGTGTWADSDGNEGVFPEE